MLQSGAPTPGECFTKILREILPALPANDVNMPNAAFDVQADPDFSAGPGVVHPMVAVFPQAFHFNLAYAAVCFGTHSHLGGS